MNEPPQWFVKHLSKYTEKSKRIGEIIKFLPVKMKMEGNTWTKKFIKKSGLSAVFNVLRLYIDCVHIGSKSEKEILTHCALSLNHIFSVNPKLFEGEFLKFDKSIELFSRLIDSSVSDIRWNTLILLTSLAMAHAQGFKLVYDVMKERFKNVCLKLKTDTTFEKKLFIMKYLAVMLTHGKAYALKHQILSELKEHCLPDILVEIEKEIESRKDTHAYHDNKDGAKDLTDLMETEIMIIRKAFDSYNPRYNVSKIQRVYETLVFKINKFNEVKKHEVLNNLNVLLNNVVSHVDEQLGSHSQYDSDDEDDEEEMDEERMFVNKMDIQFWEGLHEVSSNKVKVHDLKQNMGKYQKTLKKMKRQLDQVKMQHTISHLEFTKEKIAVIKYVEKLNQDVDVFLKEKELEKIPVDSSRSVEEIYKLMKRMKNRFQEAVKKHD